MKVKQILILILFAIAFYFNGNRLYWNDLSGTARISQINENWINFEGNITKIEVYPHRVRVHTKDDTKTLYYEGTPEKDWYIE